MADTPERAAKASMDQPRLPAPRAIGPLGTASVQELADLAAEQAVSLTGSQLGFVATLSDDERVLTVLSWSQRAAAQCAVPDQPFQYAVETMGWREAIRQRRPVIANDDAALNPWKRGLPPGHAMRTRYLSVPILDAGRVVLVAGVANKATEYDEADAQRLTLWMQGWWTVVSRLGRAVEPPRHPTETDETSRPSPDELEAIFHSMVDGVLVADAQTQRFLRVNPAICRALGYTERELLSMRVHDIHPPEALPEVLDRFRRQWKGVLPVSEDTPVLRKDGSVYYADITTNRIVYRGRDCQIGFFRDVTERRRDRQQLERDRQRLVDLLDLHDRDRRLIGFEIHDGLAQWLAAAEMHLGTFREAFAQDKTLRWDLFDAGLQLLRQGHQESRRLIDGLRIEVLEEVGLGPAIRDLVEQRTKSAAVPAIELVGETNLPWLPQPLANCAFRIVQEGLANACRHSKSPNVRIALAQHGNDLRLEVQDWGVGFHVNSRHEGRFGLESIVERARLFGGQASIESSPGHGARILVHLPLPDDLSKPNDRRAEAGDSVSGSPREP